jgi:hypothetical protein
VSIDCAMISDFRYTPLSDLPDDTVRLLELCPGQPDDRIRCNLSTAQLRLRPRFAALSYVWGSEPASQEIELNGKRFHVRENLWQCLLRLRQPTTPLILWIDAICVNQDDIEERNMQVQFMNHIFGTAKPVFAWLGEHIAAGCRNLQDDLLHFLVCLSKDWKNLYLDTVEDLETFLNVGNAVVDICKSNYWSRMWIVQEIIVSQQLFLCFGSQRVGWKDFRKCCGALGGEARPVGVLHDHPRAHEMIEQCRLGLKQGGIGTFIEQGSVNSDYRGIVAIPLHELIEAYGTKDCCDVRDRVYAVLGLRKHLYAHHLRDRPPLKADYNRSTPDLFFDVMTFEGIPNWSFGESLRKALCLEMSELKQVCVSRKSRSRDIIPSNMILECEVEEVLFSKFENLGVLGQPCCYSQFFLMRIDEERILFTESSTAKHSNISNNVLAFAMGNRDVKAGDFVFRLQYSSILFAFRYENFSLVPISRIYNLKRTKIGHQYHGSSDHYHELQTMLLKGIRAPTFVEIRNPVVAVRYEPNVLLEVMEHTIVDDEFNFDDWLRGNKSCQVYAQLTWIICATDF